MELSARFHMAVQSGTSAAIYTGNNSTVTPYPVPFPYLLASDIYVAVQQGEGDVAILAQGVDYTLTPVTDSNDNVTGGEVLTVEEYDNTWTVTIFRQVSLTQLTELPEAGPISSRSLEKAYDKTTMALQQIHRRVLALEGIDDGGSVVVIPEGSTGEALQDVQTFADATARGNAIPKRVGQLGVQLDSGSLWRSNGSGSGAWARAITLAQLQASASPRLFGRKTGGAGEGEEITVAELVALFGRPMSKTVALFRPANNEPPATNYATLDTRNSHLVLDFDTATQETAIFKSRIPEGVSLASGVVVFIQWAASTATSGAIGWDVAWERIADSGMDIDADSFGTVQTVTAASVPVTSGVTKVTSVTFTQAQLPASLAPGDAYRLRVRRDVANDNAAGDAELLLVEVQLA
jgi:hypothetical protein